MDTFICRDNNTLSSVVLRANITSVLDAFPKVQEDLKKLRRKVESKLGVAKSALKTKAVKKFMKTVIKQHTLSAESKKNFLTVLVMNKNDLKT